MSLLDTYNQMVKEASADTGNDDETLGVIEKYASAANELLAQEYGDGNYTEDDVVKVAEALIEEDSTEEYNREKVAEAYELGQIVYAGFRDALNQEN